MVMPAIAPADTPPPDFEELLLPELVGMDVSVLLAAEDVESVIDAETIASQLLGYLIRLSL